jgi:large repetitive protein
VFRVLVLTAGLAVMLVCAAPALADRAMTTRFSTNDTGNITFAANALMVCPAAAAGCTAARSTPPVASGTNAAIDNNAYNMTYVNTAPGTVAGTATFDSSSASLSLPPTATVLFAGLYWGADTSAGALQSGGGPTPAAAPNAALRGQVGLQAPGDSAYRAVTGSVDQSTTAATRYGAFADVTGIVRTAGAGTYSVANVQAGTGGDRFAGWTLVVAYRDSTQPPRNLTVDDGFVTIDSSSPPTTIPISGFRTPPSGAVRTTLGFVSYEGDAGLTGDSASLNGTTLSDGASPPGNFFDAQISNLGTNVTTRNPNDLNNWDYDSKLISADGILPNNATSANIVVTTSGDTYYPAVVTLATDLYAPNITSSKSVANITHSAGPDQRGDELRYTVSYTNSGQDAATSFVMRDPIPAGTTYVPGSLRITAGPQAPASPTDATGDDAAEFNSGTGEVVFRLGAGGNATTGGTIAAAGAPGSTVTATFDVRINSDAAPRQQIVNQATATFIGSTLGIPFTDTSPQVVNTVAAPALAIAKSHAGGFVGGAVTTFTLAVSNVGNLATDGSTVTVTDPFPASSFSALANAGGAGWTCSIAGLTLTCTRSDVLAAGNSYPPIMVDATVQELTPVTVSNTATASGGGSAPATGSDGGGASGLADLSITKSADSVTVPNGGQVAYTLNVQNAGPSAAQSVTVSDPLDPASFSNVVAQTTQGTCDATVACSLGTVDANSTVTIMISATVNADDTTLTNTATTTSPTPDPHPDNNAATASVRVPPSADLAVEKTGTQDPVQGGPDSFTITITNHGPDTASGVIVNDPLPPQFTATAATGATCSPLPTTGGTLVCTIGSLAANATVTIRITGIVAARTGGQTVFNAVTVSSNTADPDLSNNTASFSQLVTPAADLTITKRAVESDQTTPVTNPLAVGDTFDYQIVVTNHGPSPATAVIVTDTLPTGITLTATVPGCNPGAGSAGTITCTLATLAAGASHTFDLNVAVGAAAAHTTPQNSATVSSDTPDPNPSGTTTATTTVGVGDVANLSVHKSVSPSTANIGDLVTYTYSVTNNIPIGEAGGEPSGLGTTGAVVTDPLPAGVQFVAAVPPSSCTETSGTVTCHLGPVAQAQIVTASFTARVTAAAAGTNVTNRATVASEAAGASPQLLDFNPADNTDAASLTVDPAADLSLTKTVSDSNPGTDDEVQYTLTAHNAGPNDATGVMIHDLLSAGLDFIDASPGCDSVDGAVTCDIGTLASGDTASVTIRAHTTSAVAGTTVGNLANVAGNEFDPNTGNNQATATINVQPLVDLRLTKVSSNPAPTAGGLVSYTLTLVNHGPSPATGVTITDPLPSALSFVSSAGQGSCSAHGQTVTCQVGTVAAGGGAVVVITARVASSAAGASVANTATATANEPVARPQLLSARASIVPVAGPPPAAADLAIAKKANHDTGRVGEALTYTITVTNRGPATATTPTVTDTFSKSVKLVSAHVDGGSCFKRKPVVCKLSSIANGRNAQIKLVVKPRSTGRLRNSAAVTSLTPDPNTHNNVAHAIVHVRSGKASLQIKKSADRRTVGPGQSLSFAITVRSLGPSPALAVTVCDQLGSGMTYAAAHGATFRHGNACWTVSSLAKGRQRRFVVKVRAPMVEGPRRLTNSATASAKGVRKRAVRATVELIGQIPPPPQPPPVVVTG